MYFSTDDDEDVLAARPTPLAEVRPQLGGFAAHCSAHRGHLVVRAVLDVPVPQLGDQVVKLLQKIYAPALVEQVIAACRRPRNSWWKCPRSSRFLPCTNQWSGTRTSQFRTVVAVGAVEEVVKVSA